MAVQHTAESKIASIMERVRNLLARADHPNTPVEEANVCRERAEKLMTQYRLDSIEEATSAGAQITVAWRTFRVPFSAEFRASYGMIVSYVIHHFDCRGARQRAWDETAMDFVDEFVIAGIQADLDLIDMLITSCLAAFSNNLEPKVQDDLTPEANALRMRKAGMERNRIARILLGDWQTTNEMKAKTRKVTAMVKAEAARRGENVDDLFGRGNNIATYRTTFADAFTTEIWYRLNRMALSRSTEGTVVLGSLKAKVDEAFYERFPQYRPAEPKAAVESYREPNADCVKCAKAKSGYCRDHQWLKPSTAKPQERAWSAAGYVRGQNAARTVDLGRHGTGRLEG